MAGGWHHHLRSQGYRFFSRRPDVPSNSSESNSQNPWYDVQQVVKHRVPPTQSNIWSKSRSGIVAVLCFAAASVAVLAKLASPSPGARDGQ